MSALKLSVTCSGDKNFQLALDCELSAQGVTAIYGHSGSGKSTLLDCIAGLRHPTSDSVIAFGSTIWHKPGYIRPAWKRSIGYVFQDARLFPHLSVRQNLAYALNRRSSTSTHAATLDDVVRWLDLDEILSQIPDKLSAGQKQRVAIGRALLSGPQLMLLDEPLANLDHVARQQCLQCLQRVAHEVQLPMLYVSHDIEEVSQIADYLVLLEQGRLTDQGSLLDLCSRLNTRMSQEEQAAAIITAVVKQHDERYGLTELDVEGLPLFVNHLHQAPGHNRRVRIPARDVSVCRQRPLDTSILNILPVTIIEMQDSETPRLLLRLSLGSQFLLARITRRSAVELELQVGDTLYAQIKSAALLMETADLT